MPLFRVCRYILVEEYDIIEAASTEEVQALIDADKIDMTLADETAEYGPLAIYPEDEMEVGPGPLPLGSSKKLQEQAKLLRETLEKAREALDSAKGNINPERGFCDEVEAEVRSAMAAAESALEATKEGA